MDRIATANWRGDLKNGTGALSTKSEVLLEVPYSFATRFEEGVGTNPEELVAAAHAGCFSMALAGELEKSKLIIENIETVATVKIEKEDNKYKITKVDLFVSANVPNSCEEIFRKAAESAKINCPISQLLDTEISMKIQFNDRDAGEQFKSFLTKAV